MVEEEGLMLLISNFRDAEGEVKTKMQKGMWKRRGRGLGTRSRIYRRKRRKEEEGVEELCKSACMRSRCARTHTCTHIK